MSKLSLSAKRIILNFFSIGLSTAQIVQQLEGEHNITVSRQAINRFLLQYKTTNRLVRKPGSGRPSKITDAVLRAVEAKMNADDETTAIKLATVLNQCGIFLSLATIKRSQQLLGWTFHGTRYCQLIRPANKEKRLSWATKCLAENDDFDDVIWSDETSVQLELHRRHCFRKMNQPPKLKPKPKHPIKVHVWAAISKRGATNVCIFEGKMDASFYIKILEHYLLPFINSNFPSTHRFMQDNDPKHTSRQTRSFFEDNGVTWWPTPPESPDCNPIENMWHELKEFIRREVKPRGKQELIEGIQRFWTTVDAGKCCRYINHLEKFIPKVIEKQGEATGY